LEQSGRGIIEVLYRHLHGGIKENHKGIMAAGALPEIQTGCFPNANLKGYHYISLFGKCGYYEYLNKNKLLKDSTMAFLIYKTHSMRIKEAPNHAPPQNSTICDSTARWREIITTAV
jgi:hypothetical protein